MKKRLIALFMAVLMLTICMPVQPAQAAERGTCGTSVKWKFAGSTLLISGTGKMKDFESVWDTPWIDFASQISRVVVDDGVTRIGNNAFFADTNSAQTFISLRSLTLGSNVASIGANAFAGTSLTQVAFPASLKKIGAHAFEKTALRTVDCSSLDYIGDYAFSECNKFKGGTVTIGPNVAKNLNTAFFGTPISGFEVSEANSVYSSADGVLYNKAKTTLIQFPELKKVTTFTVPSTVTVIGERAFCNALYVTNIVFPDNVKTVRDGALPNPNASIPYGRSFALKNVYFGKGLKNLAVNIFVPINGNYPSYSAFFTGNMPAKTGAGAEFFNWYAPVSPGKVKIYSPKGNTTWTEGNHDSAWFGKPSLKSVKVSAPATVTIKFSKSIMASGYEVQYSRSSAFNNSKTVDLFNPASLAGTIASLKKGATYYVRVRAYKKVGKAIFYTAWCPKMAVKITQ